MRRSSQRTEVFIVKLSVSGSPLQEVSADLHPKMQEEVPVAKEFWLALARNKRVAAQEVVNHLDLPLVAASTFSFEEIEGKFQDSQEQESFEQHSA